MWSPLNQPPRGLSRVPGRDVSLDCSPRETARPGSSPGRCLRLRLELMELKSVSGLSVHPPPPDFPFPRESFPVEASSAHQAVSGPDQ